MHIRFRNTGTLGNILNTRTFIAMQGELHFSRFHDFLFILLADTPSRFVFDVRVDTNKHDIS